MIHHTTRRFAVLVVLAVCVWAAGTNGAPPEAPSVSQIIADHAVLAEKIQTGRTECEIEQQLGPAGFHGVRREFKGASQRGLEVMEESGYVSPEEREATIGDKAIDRAAWMSFLMRTARQHVDYCFDKESDSHLEVTRDLRDLEALGKAHGLGWRDERGVQMPLRDRPEDPIDPSKGLVDFSRTTVGLPKTIVTAVVGDYSLKYESYGNSVIFFAGQRLGASLVPRLLNGGFITRSLVRNSKDWTCEPTEDGMALLVGKPGDREWRIVLDPALGYRMVRSEYRADGVVGFTGEYQYDMYGNEIFFKEVRETSYDAGGALKSRETYRVLHADLNCPLTDLDFELEVPRNARILDFTGSLLYRDGDAGALPSEETEYISPVWLGEELLQLQEDRAQQQGVWQPGGAPLVLP